jgi:cytochrome P450
MHASPEIQTMTRPAHVPPEQFVDFDVFVPPGLDHDFHTGWKVLQEPGVPEVVWTPRNGGHWIATRNNLVDEVFSDHTRFTSRVIFLPKSVGEQHHLLPTTLDPPEHRLYRNVLNSGFSPKAVGNIASGIRALSVELIEAFRLKGRCDFTAEFAGILPIKVFMQMFGLPMPDGDKLKAWSDALTRPDGSVTMSDGLARLTNYMEPHIEKRRVAGGEDMLSRIANGKIGDRIVTKEEALQLAVQVLIAGLDTVVNFLAFTFTFLAQNSAHRRELAGNLPLIPQAIEELFRRFPLVTIAREVVADVEFHGAHLKKGDMIALATVLGGLDETVNPDPMTVNFHRTSSRHVTFGTGPHRCPGAQLARTELTVALEEWLTRIPEFRLAEGQNLRYMGGITASIERVELVWDPAATRAH